MQTTTRRGQARQQAAATRLNTATVTLLVVCALLAACATPPPVAAPADAPPQPGLQELLQQAEVAHQQGNREQARTRYREAARFYPTSKPPWQKLAEGYFEAGEYGNAILSAQEVLQRDPQDRIAHSILAVAGLRVSASSLSALRDPRSDLSASSREEAVLLTQTLRETLGEKSLVLPPADGVAAPAPAVVEAPRQTLPKRPARAAALTAPSATTTIAKPAPPSPSSPFDRLK